MRRPPSLQFNSSAPFVEGESAGRFGRPCASLQHSTLAPGRYSRHAAHHVAVRRGQEFTRVQALDWRRFAAAARCLSRPAAGMENRQAKAPSFAVGAAGRRQHGSSLAVLSCSARGPVPELLFRSVLYCTAHAQPAELRGSFHVGLCLGDLLACWPCQCGTETCRHGTGSWVPP